LTQKKQRRRLVGKCIDCYTKEIERFFLKTPSFGHEILKKQIEEKKNTKTTPKSGKGKKNVTTSALFWGLFHVGNL